MGLFRDAETEIIHPLENVIYVAKDGNDVTGNGTINAPYLTVSKAALRIGSAVSNADFNDPNKRYYHVHVTTGIYTESPTFGMRPFIKLEIDAALIVGDVTCNYDAAQITVAGIQQPKFSVIGNDLRASYTGVGIPLSGIDGNLNHTAISVAAGTIITILELINSGVSGNIVQGNFGAGSGYLLNLFITQSIVTGSITCLPGLGNAMTLYAALCDTSSAKALGAVSGQVFLNVIRNVRFDGAVVVIGPQGGRWYDVDFKAGAGNNFTGATGTVNADMKSLKSWFQNVPLKGALAVSAFDVMSGTTAARPVPGSGNMPSGFPYFDTTLAIPIWASGAGLWVNSVGGVV